MGVSRRGIIVEIKQHRKREITREQAIAMLKKNGIDVDDEKAQLILDLLYIFAKLTVNQLVKKQLK